MDLEKFNFTISLQTYFLEYASFCSIIRNFLKYKENPGAHATLSRNSLLNVFLSKDLKRVSNLLRGIHESSKSIIADLCAN